MHHKTKKTAKCKYTNKLELEPISSFNFAKWKCLFQKGANLINIMVF